jgi:hypothetical protein
MGEKESSNCLCYLQPIRPWPHSLLGTNYYTCGHRTHILAEIQLHAASSGSWGMRAGGLTCGAVHVVAEGSEAESAGADCEYGTTSGKNECWGVHCIECMASYSCRDVD